MNAAEQNVYFKQRLVELSGPLVHETVTTLSLDGEDYGVGLVLFDVCLRLYNAGVRDGATEIAAQAAEQGAKFDFTMAVTVPDGPLGSH
jgi:hypothetical protein